MHHLILLREYDGWGGPGCCSRVDSRGAVWDVDRRVFAESRLRMEGVGAIRSAVRDAFGGEVEVTIIDPRNIITFVPLVIRDAIRNRVPFATTVRALLSASLSSAVFDGQVLYCREIPPPAEVVERISGRLTIDHVGRV